MQNVKLQPFRKSSKNKNEGYIHNDLENKLDLQYEKQGDITNLRESHILLKGSDSDRKYEITGDIEAENPSLQFKKKTNHKYLKDKKKDIKNKETRNFN